MTREAAIRRYLEAGEYDANPRGWPGEHYVDRERAQHAALKGALMAEVRRLAGGAHPAPLPEGLQLTAFTRARVAPMVQGLFPARECEAVLRLLERSVVFLTPINVERILADQTWLHTAWDLANLYQGGRSFFRCFPLFPMSGPCLDAPAPFLPTRQPATRCGRG